MRYIKKIMILFMFFSVVFALDFETYVRLAAERDPALQADFKSFEIAMEKVAVAGALQDPNLNFAYFISPVETRLGPQRFKLSLTQMFPWFGTLRAKRKSAALEAEATYQSFLNAKNALYADLAAAYYPLLERQQHVAVQKNMIGNLQSLRSLAESRVSNGEGRLVNVLRIDRMLESARTELRILEEKRKPLEAEFNAYLDRDPATPVVLTEQLSEGLRFPEPVTDSLFASHPALKAINLKIRAKSFEEKVVRKTGLPKLGLGLDYVVVGERTDMIVAESGRDVIMPMMSLSLPLARGKYKAALKTVRLEKDRLELQRNAAENTLNTAYVKAEFTLRSLYEQLALIRGQISKTEQIRDLLLTQFSQDGGEADELLAVWRELLSYEEQLATLMSKIHMTNAKLLALANKVNI